jgi:glutamyl-Q tRNA(Asp) synthetase
MPQYIAVPVEKANTILSAATQIVTRFAPSPNGYLHIGHAYAAIAAHDFARQQAGQFLLRIEDIDGIRSRDEHIDSIVADLKWLGLSWDCEPLRQSARTKAYQAALDRLQSNRLVYRCFCSRQNIAAVLRNNSVQRGPDGPQYPGTCRHLSFAESQARSAHQSFAWRLDIKRALAAAGPMVWHDMAAGTIQAEPDQFGDVILWRKDVPASYHLAATVDDAHQGITHVVRGLDLFAYTSVHLLLQALLELPQPKYWHHPLLVDKDGTKLAKSRNAPTLRMRRLAGEDGIALAQSLRSGDVPLGISSVHA